MGGRPVGSTDEAKKDLEWRKVATTNLITQQVKEVRAAGTLSSYSYKGIHDEALEFHLLLDSGFYVNKATVIRRIQRDSLVTKRSGPKSPVAALEQALLVFIQWKQEAGQAMTPKETLQLANYLLE